MELLFLGTGAADWKMIPDEEMKRDMGKNIRRPSSMLIDGRILVDPSPSSFEFARILGVDLSGIADVLITHTHCDHYNRTSLENFAAASAQKIRLWYHELCPDVFPDCVERRPLKAMREETVGGCRVTPLPANHMVEKSDEQPLHYFIESDGKRLFYGCDGGWLLSRTCGFLMNKKLDCVVFDATVGDYNGDFRLGTHNSIPMIRMILEFMRKNGVLNDGAKIILSHLARTLHTSISETERAMAKEGMITAYDSMRTVV